MAFGLQPLLEQLALSTARVTLLVGDSGAGKSTLLATAQADACDGVTVAPAPVALRNSGLLKNAVVQGLAAAVEQARPDPTLAAQLAERVSRAADVASREVLADLGKAVAKEVLAAIKSRIGPEAGSALSTFVQQLTTPAVDELSQRLRTATEPDALDILTALAVEVAAVLGRRIVIAIDNGDRLTDSDIALLADLAESGTSSVTFRIAWSIASPGENERVQHVLDAGASRVETTGISVEAVSEWLRHSGLAAHLAPQVHRLSAGHPQIVELLVAHLLSGEDLTSFRGDAQLTGRLVDASLDRLDSAAAIAARRLSAFIDPPPPDRLPVFLGMDVSEWGEVRRRLQQARMLTVDVNGQRWFHEQRRQHLWNRLDPAERAKVATDAYREINAEFDADQSRIELLPTLSRLAADADDVLSKDAKVAAAIAADRDELIVAAALIELGEEGDNAAVLGDSLLVYAREQHAGAGDLIAALDRLATRQLVHVASNERAVAAVGMWGASGLLVLAGRAMDELGRLPVPAVGSSVFRQLLPSLGAFDRASYGVGRDPLVEQCKKARDLARDSKFWSRTVPALLVQARYRDVPMSTVVTYEDAAARDQAAVALKSLEVGLFGQPATVTDVSIHPGTPIPSLRWVHAAERLTRRSLLSAGRASLPLDSVLSPVERARRKLDLLGVITPRLSQLEARVLELDDPLGLAIASGDGWWMTAEVHGRSGLLELAEEDAPPLADPYHRLRLAEALELKGEERVGTVNVRWAQSPPDDDPAVATLEDLRVRARAYNQLQGRRQVTLTSEALTAAIVETARRRHDDACAIGEAVTVGGHRGHPEERTLRGILYLSPTMPGWVTAARDSLFTVELRGPADASRIDVVHVADSDDVPRRMSFEERFGVTEADTVTWSLSGATYGLAHLLDHDPDEVRFDLPSEPST